MKKYLAIGHFKGDENMRSIAIMQTSLKAFKDDLAGNEFVAYAIIDEERMQDLKGLDEFRTWDIVKKMVKNYRKWNDVADYIGQCYDIMEERMAAAI